MAGDIHGHRSPRVLLRGHGKEDGRLRREARTGRQNGVAGQVEEEEMRGDSSTVCHAFSEP